MANNKPPPGSGMVIGCKERGHPNFREYNEDGNFNAGCPICIEAESKRRSISMPLNQVGASLIRRWRRLFGSSPHENEADWNRPHSIEPCFCCGKRGADMVVWPRDRSPAQHLCRRCADKVVELPCEGCGSFVPAASNIQGHVWCATCYQRATSNIAKKRADRRVRCFVCDTEFHPEETVWLNDAKNGEAARLCPDCGKDLDLARKKLAARRPRQRAADLVKEARRKRHKRRKIS